MTTELSRQFTGQFLEPGKQPVNARFVHKSQTFWDDMRSPATAVNPPGLASDPDRDTTNGLWLFGSSSTELLFFTVQIPHTWYEGSMLSPHVHWWKTTSASGNVLWRFSYKWAPLNEVADAAFTDLDASTTVEGTPDTDEAQKHLITSFGDISGEGKQVSDMLIIKVSRIGGDALDTYGADAALLEMDIHYEIDGLGSAQEFTKIDTNARI